LLSLLEVCNDPLKVLLLDALLLTSDDVFSLRETLGSREYPVMEPICALLWVTSLLWLTSAPLLLAGDVMVPL
jgi:hypothetical protein